MARKKWPPPGFPLVEGEHRLTDTWSIRLPGQFARRIEDGSLVLWRPGLTIWLEVWNNDHGETQARRLAGVRRSASKDRYAEQKSTAGEVTRFSYRLLDESEAGPVESLYGFVFADDGHLEMAIYFDDPADERGARELVESVTRRSEPEPQASANGGGV
jgi:hypothetical protein